MLQRHDESGLCIAAILVWVKHRRVCTDGWGCRLTMICLEMRLGVLERFVTVVYRGEIHRMQTVETEDAMAP